MGKKKGLKITIIILTAVMMVSAFSITLITLVLNLSKKDSNVDINAVDVISDLAGLQSFAGSVYASNSYAGKTVSLSRDIDCGGAEITIGITVIGGKYVKPMFNGTFEGNGFTISNFTLGESYTFFSATAGGYTSHVATSGLFLQVGSSGIIRNLRLSNVSTELKASGGYGGATLMYTAAMVGELQGKVENCVVDGFNGQSVSGISAAGNGTIVNCYVEDIKGSIGAYGIGPGAPSYSVNASTYNNSLSISNCVSRALTVSPLATSSCHSSANSTSGLSASSASGSTGWYYHSDYNGGYPYLRQFMSWKDVTFTKGNGVSSFNPSSIKIPIDAYGTYSSSSTSITIYGQKVTVVRSSSYCNHASVSWTCNSATSYTANFNRPSRNVTVNLKEGSATAVKQTNFNVSCCNTITFQQSQPINSTTRIKEWKCTIGSYNYTAPSTHIISSIDGYSSGSKISANKTITINIARKTYNITFN